MTRVLVCGGRTFGRIPNGTMRLTMAWYRAERHADAERHLLRETLTRRHAEMPIACVIHGASSGADDLAARWAREAGVRVVAFPADWSDLSHPDAKIRAAGGRRYDANAGPRRNAQMLTEGRPDLVIGFPGGRGTADMLSRAVAAGVPVVRVER